MKSVVMVVMGLFFVHSAAFAGDRYENNIGVNSEG